jgi:hypothetical protein
MSFAQCYNACFVVRDSKLSMLPYARLNPVKKIILMIVCRIEWLAIDVVRESSHIYRHQVRGLPCERSIMKNGAANENSVEICWQ